MKSFLLSINFTVVIITLLKKCLGIPQDAGLRSFISTRDGHYRAKALSKPLLFSVSTRGSWLSRALMIEKIASKVSFNYLKKSPPGVQSPKAGIFLHN